MERSGGLQARHIAVIHSCPAQAGLYAPAQPGTSPLPLSWHRVERSGGLQARHIAVIHSCPAQAGLYAPAQPGIAQAPAVLAGIIKPPV
ncbi:MAG: hypothetical protein ACRD3T_15370 [Terriglobia bacterium]